MKDFPFSHSAKDLVCCKNTILTLPCYLWSVRENCSWNQSSQLMLKNEWTATSQKRLIRIRNSIFFLTLHHSCNSEARHIDTNTPTISCTGKLKFNHTNYYGNKINYHYYKNYWRVCCIIKHINLGMQRSLKSSRVYQSY